MTQNQKIILSSSVGLAVTVFVAWYFSRPKHSKRSNTQTQPETTTPGNGDLYNFNVPPINVPAITIPDFSPPTVTAPTPVSACCKNCNDVTQINGGKILQSGQFQQQVFHSTGAAVQNAPMPNTAPVTNALTTAIGPQLQQSAFGLAGPSYSWWKNDPTYRPAYVQAYNDVVQFANAHIEHENYIRPYSGINDNQAYGRFQIPIMDTMPGDFSTKDFDTVNNWVTQQQRAQNPTSWAPGNFTAQNRKTPITSDNVLPRKGTNYYALMQQQLRKYLTLYGDSSQGFSSIGVPDQSIPTIN